MKIQLKIVLFFTLILISHINLIAQNNSPSIKVEVYYFYGKYRCYDCEFIENSIQNTLSKYFSEQIKNGIIKYSFIKYDDPVNKAIVKKYNIGHPALVMTRYKNGKQTHYDLTDMTDRYNKKKPDLFINELKLKIQENLK